MAGLLSSGQRRGLLSTGDPAPPSIYDMPQVQQLTAPNYDAALQQPVDAARAYWDWRRRNGEQMAAAYQGMQPGATPEQRQVARDWMGNVAAGFVGGLKPEGPGIIAYHGSPHNFDRFDMSKIGTGEGAQAYGHGLYFADAEDVAQAYKQTLSRRNIAPTLDGQPITNWDTTLSNLEQQDWRLSKLLGQYGRTGGPLETFIRDQRDWYRGDKPMEAAIDQFANRVQSTFTPGSMYQVRINADPNSMLDWDKPLSEQPAAVQGALPDMKPDWTGGQIHESSRLVPGSHFDKQAAAAALRERGIPGLKYLDAGSRAAGDGTRNYVVFDDRIIDILKKYGWAPFAAGTAAGGGLLSSEGQQ